MKTLGAIGLWLISILLTLAGIFTYVIAAYVATFKLHLKVTGEVQVIFVGLFLSQIACLIGGLGLMERMSTRTSTVRG